MRAMHARLPKNFVLEERLERYGRVIELDPARLRGHWTELCYPSIASPKLSTRGAHESQCFEQLFLDLGCGKGAFLVEMAQRNPHVLFVGIDSEPICVAYTAQHITEAALSNAVVVPGNANNLESYFAEGELSTIQLNFPTPFPRKKEAHRRLVNAEHLIQFRSVLQADGELHLKTDSLPLRNFTLDELPLAGYVLVHTSNDARLEHPDDPMSEYERRLTAQGAQVFELIATPSTAPCQPRGAVSLMEYLPKDLDSLTYVPHGMQGAVVNLKNRRAHERARGCASSAQDNQEDIFATSEIGTSYHVAT